MEDLMELLGVALALLAVIALERTRWRRQPAAFLRPHFAADLTFFATGVVALGFGMRLLAQRGAAALGLSPLAAWPAPATLAFTLVLYDLGAWLAHRAMHRFEPLWRVHKVHHASPRLDWLAAFRMHPVEHALRHALSPVVLILLGFPLAHVGIASVLAGGWAAFVHGNLRVGSRAFELLFVTPRLHRVHHVAESCEHNFGAVLSLWDRAAGCLAAPGTAHGGMLGVPGELTSYPHGWWAQIEQPFRAAPVLIPNRSLRSSSARSPAS
jgi:sterol desaturase/sphingolipid hydroxylase (fatty acid hydroxylase superfamily)